MEHSQPQEHCCFGGEGGGCSTRVVSMCAPGVTRNRSSSSAVNRRPIVLCLHRHPVSVSCLYHTQMVSSVSGSFAYFARNARCTVTTDLLVWYSNTQNFSPGAAVFSPQTLASPSGGNVNYDEKQVSGKKMFLSCSFYLYRFRKYVFYGFTIIIFFLIPEYIMKRPVYSYAYEQTKRSNCWNLNFSSSFSFCLS
jgi:hypothetical protein